ncbi:MAG TPA: undecaprenyldiphospho-muramoylpentapeptide beta-N-acetylglucosaminyltransferase [Syntrophorhabdales bacterium]|nr:undecaprenyldiphospho-muramoylpentapeptide beta-N-acetylglucosaminyltransferase [Syntrophorhabdales bacterium]
MKLLIAAGGTGGHIFPGVAVAEAFMAADSANQLFFVGTSRGMEGAVIPERGFRLLKIDAQPFLGQSFTRKAFTIVSILRGVVQSIKILRREKPDMVIGMGGFTCVPVMIAAFLMRVPRFLHEQNVVPGLANRLLCRIADKTFISFSKTRDYLKGSMLHTGNPVRKKLRVASALAAAGGTHDLFNIFVFGGSRGARSINEAVLLLLPYLESYKNTAIYHQTGNDDYQKVKEAYATVKIPHEVFPFTDEMEKYYSLSDVVIARAGASTIFELSYFKKAAVLVPYPYAAGAHQWKNAAYVEEIGGAYVVGNDELSGDRLNSILKEFYEYPELRARMAESMGTIYVENAEELILKGMATNVS